MPERKKIPRGSAFGEVEGQRVMQSPDHQHRTEKKGHLVGGGDKGMVASQSEVTGGR